MKFAIRHYSLKKRLFLSVFLIVFVSIILVSAIGSAQYSRHLIAQNTVQTQQLIDQLALNTGSYISELSSLCMSPYYNEQVMKLLDVVPMSSGEILNTQRTIENYLREVMTIPRKDILRVSIMTDRIYSSGRTGYAAPYARSFRQEEWYADALESPTALFIPAQIESHGSRSATVFSMVLRLQSLADSRRTVGVIRVDANYSGIKDVLDNVELHEKSALFIFDANGSTIYRRGALPDGITDQDMFRAYQDPENPARLAGERFLFHSRSIAGTDWTVVAVNAESVLMRNVYIARRFAMILAVVCSLLALVVTAIFTNTFVRPLNRTIDIMHAAQAGDLTVRAPDSAANEIASLNSSFNEMLQKISDTMENNSRLSREMYESKYLQKKAQYDALYNQIRPHFLFNTLNLISLQIKSGREAEAVKSIDDFSVLLRGMVNTDKDISLAAELKVVQSYLRLQARRHDEMTFEIDADETVLGCMLPALTVQPIVENALVHGCEPSRASMRIRIQAVRDGSDVLIHVADNGIGMDDRQLEALRRRISGDISEPVQDTTRSVGLQNIAQRLRLRFGDRSEIVITSTRNEGTCVTVRIPIEVTKEDTIDAFVQNSDRR